MSATSRARRVSCWVGSGAPPAIQLARLSRPLSCGRIRATSRLSPVNAATSVTRRKPSFRLRSSNRLAQPRAGAHPIAVPSHALRLLPRKSRLISGNDARISWATKGFELATVAAVEVSAGLGENVPTAVVGSEVRKGSRRRSADCDDRRCERCDVRERSCATTLGHELPCLHVRGHGGRGNGRCDQERARHRRGNFRRTRLRREHSHRAHHARAGGNDAARRCARRAQGHVHGARGARRSGAHVHGQSVAQSPLGLALASGQSAAAAQKAIAGCRGVRSGARRCGSLSVECRSARRCIRIFTRARRRRMR